MSVERRNIIIAHSSLAEYEFDGDDLDKYYLPARGLAEAPAFSRRGQRSTVIVPQSDQIRQLADFYRHTILDKGSVLDLIETPDSQYLMDRDIFESEEVMREILQINRSGMTEIYPYAITDEFMQWAKILIDDGSVVVGDKKRYLDPKWWGHKGGLHRWISSLDQPSFAEESGLPVAEGYVARNQEEILQACNLLGTHGVMLKPYILSGGFDMQACRSKEDVESYRIPLMPTSMGGPQELMPVAVEELLDIDVDSNGENVYSMQFTGNKVLGKLTRQLVHGGTHWIGNQEPSGATGGFEREAEIIVRRFLSYAKPNGPGGVDIASVRGKPVVLEINGGRPTGAHNPKNFKLAYAPSAVATVFEKEDRADMLAIDVETAWDRLKGKIYNNRPLAFSKETQVGVYPLVWLEGMWAMLIAFGESPEISRAMLEESKTLLYT